MNTKNAITMTTLSVIAIFAITSITVSANEVLAVLPTNYKMVEDTYAKITFTFRDGVEETYFPVFKMTTSYVANTAAEFQLQGIVEDYPLLNEAMDQEYDFRLAPPETQYDYKQFVVDVDLIAGGVVQKSFHYTDCKVDGSYVDTLLDVAEGYTTTKTGFAIINVIDFDCTGVTQKTTKNVYTNSPNQIHDYGKNSQKLAEDVHSYATFYFNNGAERIDFPVFKLNTGFDEKSKDRPSFSVQGIVKPHVLLDNSISKAKQIGGASSLYNDDFQVNVDFANDSKTFRTLKYSDCRIEEYKVDTLFDKEEGYTGKSGFAIVEDITVTCAGLTTKNYSEKTEQNIVNSNPYIMGGMTQVFTTITMDNGAQEKINFPVFKQTSTVDTNRQRLNPSFQLQGVVGDYPVLYKVVDQIRTRGPAGTDFQGLFSVDVEIIHNEKLVKKYQYKQCRVTSYDADTSFNNEEGYVGSNGFALLGIYNFECTGYHPSNPSYEEMNMVEKAQNQSTSSLRNTDSWRSGFFVQK